MSSEYTVDGQAAEYDVCGHVIQIDRSGGQGHCWRIIPADEIPANVRMEIEGEIVDGGKDEGQIIASNGQHYRWS